jgi:uncharacterized membrane protein YwzB
VTVVALAWLVLGGWILGAVHGERFAKKYPRVTQALMVAWFAGLIIVPAWAEAEL